MKNLRKCTVINLIKIYKPVSLIALTVLKIRKHIVKEYLEFCRILRVVKIRVLTTSEVLRFAPVTGGKKSCKNTLVEKDVHIRQ